MTSEDSTFVLRDLIRETMAKMGDPDPRVIWQKVVQQIPEHRLREALLEVGPSLVRRIQGDYRRQVLDPKSVVHEPPREPVAPLQGASRMAQAGAVRYASFKAMAVHVNGDHKYLGDCTVADLAFATSERMDLAKRNAWWADWLKHMSKAITDAGVKTVGGLPNNFDISFGGKFISR